MKHLREYGAPTEIRPSSDDAILCTPFGSSPAPAVTEDNPPTADGAMRLVAAGLWQRAMNGEGDDDAQG